MTVPRYSSISAHEYRVGFLKIKFVIAGAGYYPFPPNHQRMEFMKICFFCFKQVSDEDSKISNCN